MRERGEGPVHVVANVLRRGVSTTTGRGVERARYALHEGHTHELLSSIANVLGDPHVVGASVATLRARARVRFVVKSVCVCTRLYSVA